VNTDQYGFGRQHTPSGKTLNIATLAEDFEACNVLLGGSVVFGVAVSSDRATITSYLTSDDHPFVNLGTRGATSQHELSAFLLARPYLPPVREIVLLTGVNECILASRPVADVYELFGDLRLSLGTLERKAAGNAGWRRRCTEH
jgi:hypothetical protein